MQAVEAAALAFLAGSVYGAGSSDVYPWAGQVSYVLASYAASRCPLNRTFASDGTTYGRFAKQVRGPEGYKRGEISPAAVQSLLSKGRQFNRHIRVCPFAVLMALALNILDILHNAQKVMSDVAAWNLKFRDSKQCHRVLESLEKHLLCPSCDEDWHADVATALQPFGGWGAMNWVMDDIAYRTQTLWDFQHAVNVEKRPPMTDQEYLEFLRDGRLLIDSARDAGLLREWVITHGTLLTALRYGAGRAPVLPSGITESRAGSNYDMDIFVDTSRWSDFTTELAGNAKKFGFSFCGWEKGWSKTSMSCRRGRGELDVHLIDRKGRTEPNALILSMTPVARCLVGRREDGTVVELPCPRDPLVFMQYLWRHVPHYTACLPLPLPGEEGLSEEDLLFLWQRALELQQEGYMNMAAYFGECEGHPLSESAQALYWHGWAETIER